MEPEPYQIRPIETAEQSIINQRIREQSFLLHLEIERDAMASQMLAARAQMPPGAPISAGLLARGSVFGAPQRRAQRATRGPRSLDLDF